MEKWKTIVTLTLMLFAIFFDWGWFWAILIFMGLVHIIQSGEIHFVEFISKDEHPKLYWTMIGLWALMAFYQMWNYLQY